MRQPVGKTMLLAALAVLLTAGPAVAAGPGAKGSDKAEKGTTPTAPLTVEAGPPLTLDIQLVNLQKNSRGGVASLSMETRSASAIDPVTLVVDLPTGVTFTDGSRNKSWTFSLAAGGTVTIPADLLVADDGKYVVRGQTSGTFHGKLMHRGTAFRLLVGVQDTPPPVKDGAIEYPGVPGGGV